MEIQRVDPAYRTRTLPMLALLATLERPVFLLLLRACRSGSARN